MEDNELMARLALGDENALAELIARHRTEALRLAEGMLRDTAAAEDVVQEAFTRVYLTRHSYQATFSFRTYLSVLVRHLCIDDLRRKKYAPLPTADIPEQETSSAEAMYLRREQRMRLWNELSALDETDRALLTGYALEGRSYQELSRRLGLSLPQVKIRLHRIRKRLRAKGRDEE